MKNAGGSIMSKGFSILACAWMGVQTATPANIKLQHYDIDLASTPTASSWWEQ